MDNDWLNLSEAAELLGVHPATVRAWSDRGELPMQRTPGGHRRFRRADVEARTAVPDRTQLTGANILIQNMLGKARLELVEGEADLQPWHQGLDEAVKKEHRDIGRRLLHLVIDYIAHARDEANIIAEAQRIGRDYAQIGRANGLSLTDNTRAYLFFREFLAQAIDDMIIASGGQGPTDWAQIRQQVTCLTNEVLLALIAAYEASA
ncbi:MAG: helix-turn-helix domain-containing protein [Anaerolineales bacterium]|nr:helix-turn-helix domain-containing protein [Anaerolineales bacterium]